MNKNKFEIYVEATKKQIRALEEGIELLMIAEPEHYTAPAVDTSELEKAIQQERSLRVKAESSAEEFKRKFEEAMAELTKEREARQADNIKWAAEVGRSMKKDEKIEDLKETIEDLRVQLAAKPKEIIKEVVKEVVVETPVKRTPDVRKNDQTIKANIKQQLAVIEEQEVPVMPAQIEEQEVPVMPAQNNIPSIEENEVPDMVYPDPTFKLFVTFQKNCANCPFVNTCDVKKQQSSKIGKDCGLLEMKNAAVNAEELHVKVNTEKNKYVFPAYTKNGIYVGDIHKNRENKDAIAELQKHRNKTVILKTTAFKVVKDSVFTRYQAEIVDVIDNVDTESTSTSITEELVFEDMTIAETPKEEATNKNNDVLISFGEMVEIPMF